jgi:hypothetical protein
MNTTVDDKLPNERLSVKTAKYRQTAAMNVNNSSFTPFVLETHADDWANKPLTYCGSCLVIGMPVTIMTAMKTMRCRCLEHVSAT